MTLSQEEFDKLCQEWYDAACIHSFPWTIMRGPAYEQLKAAGLHIVPFLLKKVGDDPWIAYLELLHEITGADIFAGEQDTDFRKYDVEATAKAWQAWGKNQGYYQ